MNIRHTYPLVLLLSLLVGCADDPLGAPPIGSSPTGDAVGSDDSSDSADPMPVCQAYVNCANACPDQCGLQ